MATTGDRPGTPGSDPRAGKPSAGTGQFGAQQESGSGERMQQAGQKAGDEIRGEAEQASGKAENLKEEAKKRASQYLDEAKDKARSAIEERKEGLAQDVGDFAHALRASASDLQDHQKDYVAQYVEQAASSVDQIADTLQRQDLKDLMRHTEDFARRQPGLFIGGAVAAGFALARFLKSSGERRMTDEPGTQRYPETQQHEAGYRGEQPMPSASTPSYGATPADRPSRMEGSDHGRF